MLYQNSAAFPLSTIPKFMFCPAIIEEIIVSQGKESSGSVVI